MDEYTTAIYVSTGVITLIALVIWLTQPREDGGPTRWQRWRAWFVAWLQSDERLRAYVVSSIIMSCEVVRDGSEPAEPEAVSPDTDAERTTLTEEKDASPPPAPDDITDEQLVKLLAAMKRADGSNRWSGNAIAAFVGGTRAQVLDWIGEVRPRQPAPAAEPRASVPGEAPPPVGSLRRPKEGW